MTKMVATPMLKTLRLSMQHLGLLSIIVYSNDDPGVTLAYFMARSNMVTEKVKTMNFSETIEACDLKVGICRQLIDFMNEGQGHFLTLAQGHLHMKIKTCFSQKHLAVFNQILYVNF